MSNEYRNVGFYGMNNSDYTSSILSELDLDAMKLNCDFEKLHYITMNRKISVLNISQLDKFNLQTLELDLILH